MFNLEVLFVSMRSGHPPQAAQPLPHMVCGDPESGTDHSQKEVSAGFILNRSLWTG